MSTASQLILCENKATSTTGWESFAMASCRLESKKNRVVVRSSQMLHSPSTRMNEI